MFDTLVHGLEGIVDTVDEDACIDVDEKVVHPCLVPLLPVRRSDPRVLEGFKVFSQPTHLVILQKNKAVMNREKLTRLIISTLIMPATFEDLIILAFHKAPLSGIQLQWYKVCM